MSEWLTTRELALRLRVQPRTIRQWARKGLIPVLRVSPKVMRFDIEAVERTITERGSRSKGGQR